MSSESNWLYNDLKIELLALKMKRLRQEYTEKNPNMSKEEIENHINRRLDNESNLILTYNPRSPLPKGRG